MSAISIVPDDLVDVMNDIIPNKEKLDIDDSYEPNYVYIYDDYLDDLDDGYAEIEIKI